jgi:hypothetical protein
MSGHMFRNAKSSARFIALESHVFRNTETAAKCFSRSIYFLCIVTAVISDVVVVSDLFKALCYEETQLNIVKTRN